VNAPAPRLSSASASRRRIEQPSRRDRARPDARRPPPHDQPHAEELARIQRRRTVRYSVPSFLLLPELLQIDDLIALVPSRLLRGHGERLALLRSPINVPGFDVIAVWHPRVEKDIALRWLRMRLSQTAGHV
jgi:DNA-binding transcriptional LysR family regulator